MTLSRYFRYIIALFAGAILPFAFSPFYFYPLAIISLAIYCWLLLGREVKPAVGLGFVFGLGYFLVGVSWVFISIHRFGGSNMVVAATITLLFAMLLAVAPALQAFLLQYFFKQDHARKIIFAFPATWVITEWLRSHLFTGFPWLLIGGSQIHSVLRGFAPIGSVYLVSFITALSSGLIVYALRSRKKARYISLISVCLIWLLGAGLAQVHWTKRVGEPMSVGLVQGNIPQSLKWNPEVFRQTLGTYKQLTNEHWNSDLIIWPETAIPVLLNDVQPYVNALNIAAMAHHATVITGVPIQQAGKFYNGLVALGDGSGMYFKRHLVPFGEYVPLQKYLRGIINFFDLPMSNFSKGAWHQPLVKANGITISPYICYEIAYAEEVRSTLDNADAIITISDDSWFGDSFAPYQHLAIGQMRALETGRYVLFSTNNGPSAIVNPQGQVVKQSKPDKKQMLSGKFYTMQGETPWLLVGMWPFWGLVLLCLGIAWRRRH